jgi:hypothetical protein
MEGIDHPDPITLLQAILTYVETVLNEQLSPEDLSKQVE